MKLYDNLDLGSNPIINVTALSLINSGFLGSIVPTTLTAPRTYTLKDESGTIAFLSDITGDGNGIYDGSGSLTGNTTVSMGTNDLIFASTGEPDLLRFDTVNDHTGIGVDPTARLHVKGKGFSGGTTNFLLENSLGADLFTMWDDGHLGINAIPSISSSFSLSTISGDVNGLALTATNLTANGVGATINSLSTINNTAIRGTSNTSGGGVSATGVEGISIGGDATNNYGVRATARNGSTVSYAVYGQVEAGASVVSSSSTNAIVGVNQSSNGSINRAGFLVSLATSGTSIGAELSASGGANNYALLTDLGRIGFGTLTPTAFIHADQKSTTAAIPVLKLDQADVSEEFIDFIAVEGVGNSVEDVGAKALTTTKFLRVSVNGVNYYLQAGTIA